MKIPLVPHRAVRMVKSDYDKYDYLIGMDSANIRNMEKIAGGDLERKIYKLPFPIRFGVIDGYFWRARLRRLFFHLDRSGKFQLKYMECRLVCRRLLRDSPG